MLRKQKRKQCESKRNVTARSRRHTSTHVQHLCCHLLFYTAVVLPFFFLRTIFSSFSLSLSFPSSSVAMRRLLSPAPGVFKFDQSWGPFSLLFALLFCRFFRENEVRKKKDLVGERGVCGHATLGTGYREWGRLSERERRRRRRLLSKTVLVIFPMLRNEEKKHG